MKKRDKPPPEPELKRQIQALIEAKGNGENADLVADIIENALKLLKDVEDRGDVRVIQTAVRELRYAFKLFAPHAHLRKVTLFGSARTPSGRPDYQQAKEFARRIADEGWMVITGAGPGIMAAGHEGAGAKASFGVGIKLPMEQRANGFIAGDPKLIDFKYFFTRKIMFMKESDAFVLLPGGYGTLDEGFELLTLMQTGKTAIRPVVLLQPPGNDYWDTWIAFVREHVVDRGLASPVDLALFEVASSVEEALAIIERFYANYDSARYVGERLVLRLKRAPSPAELGRLNRDFADIVARGRIETISITPAEAKDADAPELARIAFFPVSNFGRIRQLIDALNRLA